MKILISPSSFDDAVNLIKKHVDILVVGSHKFSVRNQADINIDQIRELIKIKHENTELWVNVNGFFFESQIGELKNYLDELDILNVDRVIFNDMAIPTLHEENGYHFKLHYDPSTLITSYGQLNFYVDNGFHSISIANELFWNEVQTILNHKPQNLEICVQIHGLIFIMHSKWNLISNFKEYVNDHQDEYIQNKMYYIREFSRKYHNVIYEDEHGTHMLSGYELCLVKYLEKLYKAQTDYIWINNLSHSTDGYAYNVYRIYHQLIDKLINQTYTEQDANDSFQQLSKLSGKYELSEGFIGGVGGILNYEKK